jgi:hypothetical protein
MTRMHGIVLIALTVLISSRATGATQSLPDFSGSWKPEARSAPPPLTPRPQTPPAANAPAGPLPTPPPPPPPQTVGLAIVQTATELRVDRTVQLGDRTAVYKLVYKLDGSESVNQTGPIFGKTKASWEGSRLVLTTVHHADEKILGDSREVYSLEEGKLVIEGTRNMPVGRMTSRDVFVKP